MCGLRTWSKFSNQMKSPALLLVPSLLALLSAVGSSVFGGDLRPDVYAYPFDGYTEPSDLGSAYSRYGDWSPGLDVDEETREASQIPEWYPVPWQADPVRTPWPEPYADRAPGERAGEYLLPYGQDSYREDWIRWQRGDMPWGSPGFGPSGMRRRLPSAAAHGYRFRGDQPDGFRRWGEPQRRDVYRFRPLTEEERRRMGVGTEWRLRKPTPSGVRPGQRDPIPTRETYGYAPDSRRDSNFDERY